MTPIAVPLPLWAIVAYVIVVIGQLLGRAIAEDTAAREGLVWDACLFPGEKR